MDQRLELQLAGPVPPGAAAEVPEGNAARLRSPYDNSDKNPLNPNTPPKEVTWGEQTTDEMFLCFFLVTTDRPEDQMPLMVDNFRAMGPRMKKAEKRSSESAAERDAGDRK